jgi:hypothetical protein
VDSGSVAAVAVEAFLDPAAAVFVAGGVLRRAGAAAAAETAKLGSVLRILAIGKKHLPRNLISLDSTEAIANLALNLSIDSIASVSKRPLSGRVYSRFDCESV